MGYAVHIERRRGGRFVPIDADEWLTAVERTEDVRLAEGVTELEAPREGGKITVGARVGDAQVYFREQDVWHTVFLWSPSGRATCKTAPSFDDEADAVRVAARRLAAALDAVVIGDEGETYA